MTNDEQDDGSGTAPGAGPFVEDRRDHRRVGLETSVTIHSPATGESWSDEVPSSAGGLAHGGLAEEAEFMVDGTGEDISVGGMYLRSEERLPAGGTVTVEFDIPELDQDFDLIGEVRWTRRMSEVEDGYRWGVGLEFKEMDSERIRILEDYVLEKLSE